MRRGGETRGRDEEARRRGEEVMSWPHLATSSRSASFSSTSSGFCASARKAEEEGARKGLRAAARQRMSTQACSGINCEIITSRDKPLGAFRTSRNCCSLPSRSCFSFSQGGVSVPAAAWRKQKVVFPRYLIHVSARRRITASETLGQRLETLSANVNPRV